MKTKFIPDVSCFQFLPLFLVAILGSSIVFLFLNVFYSGYFQVTVFSPRVDKEDEMECMIKGCNFVLRNIPEEVFEYRRHVNPEYKFHSVEPNMYPYLLVNIGSGVSVMMVSFN